MGNALKNSSSGGYFTNTNHDLLLQRWCSSNPQTSKYTSVMMGHLTQNDSVLEQRLHHLD